MMTSKNVPIEDTDRQEAGQLFAPEEAIWEVPAPLSTCDVDLDENTVTTVRRHGNPAGPRLVLSHGNGLAIDPYYPFWSMLTNDFDVMVFDIRNHGRNKVGAQQDHNIPTLISDHDLVLDAIAREYGEKPTVGVFHSLSALITLLSFSDAFSALVLFDPPLCKPNASELEFIQSAERMAAMIRNRAVRFKSEKQFAELLAIFPGFDRVVPGVRELMARSTLRRAADGEGYELRCPREYEAQIAEYVRSFSPLLDLSTLTCPTKVIGADPTLPFTYLPTFDLSHVSEVDYDFVPDATHLLQLEEPEQCAEMLRGYLATQAIQ